MKELFTGKDAWDQVILNEAESVEYEFEGFTVEKVGDNWLLHTYTRGEEPEQVTVLLEGPEEEGERIFLPNDQLFLLSEYGVVFTVEDLNRLKAHQGEIS